MFREIEEELPENAVMKMLRPRFKLRPNSRALRALDPGLRPQFTPPKCLLIPPQQKGTRSNTVPQPQILVFPNTAPNITFQEYVVGLIYTIENIIDSSYIGWENFLKIH